MQGSAPERTGAHSSAARPPHTGPTCTAPKGQVRQGHSWHDRGSTAAAKAQRKRSSAGDQVRWGVLGWNAAAMAGRGYCFAVGADEGETA